MILDNTNNFSSPVRRISAIVELYNGSTLAGMFTPSLGLKELSIERMGVEGKFFGFSICQKLKLELLDKERKINIDDNYNIKIGLSSGGSYIYPFPLFHVKQTTRNENTNNISVEAYDALYTTNDALIADLSLQAPYTIGDVAAAIAASIGAEPIYININDESFNVEYEQGINIEGTETIREILTALAEATQCIAYLDNNNKLAFKRLDVDGAAVLNIDKSNYFTLESKEQRTLTSIVSATELGDNVSAGDASGSVQYLRDNPFIELRDDIAELLEAALNRVNGLSINEFTCSWRGNFLVEPGDKLTIEKKDGNLITTYLLNDTLKFTGGFAQDSAWSYEESNESSNPTTLGEALKKTYAKVDKANAEIEIVAGETANIKLTTDGIQNTVVKLDDELADIVAEVNTKVSANDVSYSIQSAMNDGIERVITTTGYTFNEEGLHISKNTSEISTSITENGMAVYKDDTEVLKADNYGVKAEDLHATTFLIIGNNSRLEDYNSNRTGCFWIGG